MRSAPLPRSGPLDPSPARRRYAWALVAAATAVTVAVSGCTPTEEAAGTRARVHDIQGAGHVSPLHDEKVSAVPGVVTAVHAKGFWLQDTEPDDKPATSEAVYVFTKSRPDVKVGETVEVSGTVTEFRPGDEEGNLSVTEIEKPEVKKVGNGELPAPVKLGENKAPDVVRTDKPGDVETSNKFDPKANALDHYEALEGMRVQISDATVVGPSGEMLAVLPDGASEPRTERDGLLYDPDNAPTQRVLLDNAITQLPTADVGDQLPGDITGVLHYDFGNYAIEATERPRVERKNLARETAQAPGDDEISLASFNVENLAPSDSDGKFEKLAGVVKDNLASPDVLVAEEVQDNSGKTDDGTVAANKTLDKLTQAIKNAGGPEYTYRTINPQDNADGGQPGGNIRNVFLYRADRVSFADREGGDAQTAVKPVNENGTVRLSASPGRVDPKNPAFRDSRKPMVGEFSKGEKKLFVVAVHLTSKNGNTPQFGRFQPPRQPSESTRIAQAKAIRGFTDQLLAQDGNANVVVIGDYNDEYDGQAVRTLTDGGAFTNASDSLRANQRYSYVFDGVSEQLDQAVLSRNLAGNGRFRYDLVHLNSEFAQQVSDHDPQLLRLRLG